MDRLLSDFQTIVDLSEQYVAASYTRKLSCQKINVWTFIDSFLFKNCFIVNLEAVIVDSPKKNSVLILSTVKNRLRMYLNASVVRRLSTGEKKAQKFASLPLKKRSF